MQSAQPVYSGDGGHGMLFKKLDGTLYLTIHTPNQTPNERPIFVEMEERDGTLAPTGQIIK